MFTVAPEMLVENEHTNAQSSGDNLDIIVDGLAPRGKSGMLGIEEDAVILQSRQGEDYMNLHNPDLCYEQISSKH